MLTARTLAVKGLSHGFFGRRGGVSSGIYSELNCGPGSKDNPAAVRENRARVAAKIGIEAGHLLSMHQIHSADAVTVSGPYSDTERPRADALVTDRPGLALGVLTADCVPVLLADPEARVIGAAHAGWRGAISGILRATVAAMTQLGARSGRIRAAIGPCIRQRSYEVGPEFPDPFLDSDPDNVRFFGAGERPGYHQFDLAGFCRKELTALDLGEIEDLERDTCAEEDEFFSYRRATHRREGDYGREISVIALEER